MIAWLIATAGLRQTSFARRRAGAPPAGTQVSRWLGEWVSTVTLPYPPSRAPLTESKRCASSRRGRRPTRSPLAGGWRASARATRRTSPVENGPSRIHNLGSGALVDLDAAGQAVLGELGGARTDHDLAGVRRRASRGPGRRAPRARPPRRACTGSSRASR